MPEKYQCAQCGAEVENPGTICDECFRGNEAFDRQLAQEQEEERQRSKDGN